MGIGLDFSGISERFSLTGKSKKPKKSERKKWSQDCIKKTLKKQEKLCRFCGKFMEHFTYEKHYADGDNSNNDCNNLWIVHADCRRKITKVQEKAKNAIKKKVKKKTKKKKDPLEINLDF